MLDQAVRLGLHARVDRADVALVVERELVLSRFDRERSSLRACAQFRRWEGDFWSVLLGGDGRGRPSLHRAFKAGEDLGATSGF